MYKIEYTKTPGCQNCETPLQGTYCHQCGQKSPQDRITLKLLLDLVVNSVFDIDKGFLFTCREILLRPHILITNYLEGKRINYTNPIKLLLIWLGVATLITFAVLDFDKMMAKNMNKQLEKQQSFSKLFKRSYDVDKMYLEESLKATSFFAHNQQLFYVLLIPFISFLMGVFFKKQGYYFSEHLVITTYNYAGFHILSCLLYPLYLFEAIDFYVLSAIMLIFMMGIMAYFATRFYGQKGNKWKAGIKASIVYIISYVIYTLSVGIFVAIYAITQIVLTK